MSRARELFLLLLVCLLLTQAFAHIFIVRLSNLTQKNLTIFEVYENASQFTIQNNIVLNGFYEEEKELEEARERERERER